MSNNKKNKRTREIVQSALKFVKGRVLDLGAGSRAKHKSIVQTQADEYVAFDLVAGENIDIVGDINNTGFKNESFDTVLCNQVFEHIPQPWLAVKEIKRILKKDGMCIITAPFLQPYHADPHDYFRYTHQGLRSLFENEGFEIIESDIYGESFMVLVEFIQFVWFDPFKKYKKGSYRVNLLLDRIAKLLNNLFKSKEKKIYSNVYVAARKRLM